MIYLISDTGAVKTNDERGAALAELLGYHRVSRIEYVRKLREIARKDEKAGREANQ